MQKMRNNIIIQLIILSGINLFLSECNTSKKIKEYENFKSQITETATENLPLKNKKDIERSSFMIIHYPDAMYVNRFSGVFIGINYNTIEFKNKLHQIEKVFDKIPTDNKLIKYIPSLDINNNNDIILPNIKNDIIIPNNFLSNNVVFYRKKQLKGNFLNEDNTKYYKISKNLYHGFSSGVVVDNTKKEIVYWFLIW